MLPPIRPVKGVVRDYIDSCITDIENLLLLVLKALLPKCTIQGDPTTLYQVVTRYIVQSEQSIDTGT